MDERTRNEIASWLLDRVAQGEHEEEGSMDYADFGRTRTTIMKDGTGYIVWLGMYMQPDFTLHQETSEELIRSAIDLCCDLQ